MIKRVIQRNVFKYLFRYRSKQPIIAGIEKQKNIPMKLLFPNVEAVFEFPGRLKVNCFKILVTKLYH